MGVIIHLPVSQRYGELTRGSQTCLPPALPHSNQCNKTHLFQASFGSCPCPLNNPAGLPIASPIKLKLLLRGLWWVHHHMGPWLPAPTFQSRVSSTILNLHKGQLSFPSHHSVIPPTLKILLTSKDKASWVKPTTSAFQQIPWTSL